MDDGTQFLGLTISHDVTNTHTIVYLVVGTSDPVFAIKAAELHTGLTASHADPDDSFAEYGDGFTVTLFRRF